MAGDMAVMDGSDLIGENHMSFAIKNAVSIEDQIIKDINHLKMLCTRIYQVLSIWVVEKHKIQMKMLIEVICNNKN
jgi:predicted ATP-dependent protease